MLLIVPESGTARRVILPGLLLFLISIEGFVYRSVDKGVDALSHAFGVGFQGIFLSFCHGYIDTVIVIFDVLIHGSLVCLCDCQGTASFLHYRGSC